MKKYEAYKDSGIEWIGEIPVGWEILKMRYILSGLQDGTHGTFERVDEGYPLLSAKNVYENGIIIEDRESYISKSDYEAIISNGYPQKGDIAICCVGSIGRCCIYTYDIPHAFQRSVTFMRTNELTIPEYLVYYLRSFSFQYQLGMYAKTSAQSGIYLADIAKTLAILPSVSEQQTIASYLDHKVDQIDASVSAINSQIDDLKAYRQSIISEAVTKGLNPDVKMKDSGVEWIGEIPETWKCTKLGWLYPNMGSGTTPDTNNLNYYSENGYNWLQTGDLNDGVITETSKHITDLAVNERGMKIYPSGSVVVAMYGATIGKVGLLSIDTTTNQACCVLPIMENIYNRYTFYVMLSSKMSLISKSVGGGQPNISQTIIKEHKIPVPPLHEQQAIASYLDSKTIKIDSVIKSLEAQRNDLNALKQSIISEAVTGKIDLREWKQRVEQ